MRLKLSAKKNYREHILRNLVTSLILYEKIKTTHAKSRVVKSAAEKLIEVGKQNNLSARRKLLKFFFDKKAVVKILDVLAPRYSHIKGGYVRVNSLGNRLGDNAPTVLMTFTSGQGKDNEQKKSRSVNSPN